MWCGAAQAQDSFTLTGAGGRERPLVLRVIEGSELTPCTNNSTTMMRCLFVDQSNEADIAMGYYRQILTQGFFAANNYPGAAPGLRSFVPGEAQQRCPHVVMVLPNATRITSQPAPEGRVAYNISLSPDILCIAGQQRVQ